MIVRTQLRWNTPPTIRVKYVSDSASLLARTESTYRSATIRRTDVPGLEWWRDVIPQSTKGPGRPRRRVPTVNGRTQVQY